MLALTFGLRNRNGAKIQGTCCLDCLVDFVQGVFKGELQHRKRLISFETPFKILQNETKIIKIRQAVLEIFNLKYIDLDSCHRKNDIKTKKCCFLEVLQ